MTPLIEQNLPGMHVRPLTRAQFFVLLAIGAALWLFAAVLLRVVGPMGAYEGVARVALYGLIVPGTVPFVILCRRIAGLAQRQTAIGVAAATASATLLDGIALAWFPTLYGSEVALVAGASATILWGAGVGLVLGFMMNGPRGP